MGPGTGRGSGQHTGSRLQPGGTQGQTDRRLPGGEVECAHRGSTPRCWSCLRAPQASPLTYPVEKPRQGWLVPVPREGRRSWPWTQAHLISRSPNPGPAAPPGSGHGGVLCLQVQVPWWGSFCSHAARPALGTPVVPGLASGGLGGHPEVGSTVCSSGGPAQGAPGTCCRR